MLKQRGEHGKHLTWALISGAASQSRQLAAHAQSSVTIKLEVHPGKMIYLSNSDLSRFLAGTEKKKWCLADRGFRSDHGPGGRWKNNVFVRRTYRLCSKKKKKRTALSFHCRPSLLKNSALKRLVQIVDGIEAKVVILPSSLKSTGSLKVMKIHVREVSELQRAVRSWWKWVEMCLLPVTSRSKLC